MRDGTSEDPAESCSIHPLKSNATEYFALPESFLRKIVTVLLPVLKVREQRSGAIKLV